MRRWALLPIAALFAAAWWFLHTGSQSPPIAPVAAPSVAVAAGANSVALESGFDDEITRTQAPVGVQGAMVEPDSVVPEDDQPKTRLTVRCRLPDGSPWIGGGVALFARDRPIESDEPLFRSRWSSGRTGELTVRAYSDASGHRIGFTTDGYGRVVFDSVVVGQAFEVEAFDALYGIGASVSCLPMTPGESRELELWLSSAPQPLRGRCVDEQGSPVAGAQVLVSPAGSGRSAHWRLETSTNDSGEFVTDPLFAQSTSLTASFEDFVDATVANVRPSVPVELVLRKGRRLAVEVVDGFGNPVEVAVVTVHAEPESPPLAVRSRFIDGAHLYSALPMQAVTLRWGGICSPQTLLVDASTERVRLQADPLGQLAVTMSELPGGLDATYWVWITCSHSDVPAADPKNVLNTGRQQMLWHLPPGRYRLQIHVWNAAFPDTPQPWGAPVEVEVRSGETTLERLGG
jgi:hypothetical protein